jgi:general secretion pathway protein F
MNHPIGGHQAFRVRQVTQGRGLQTLIVHAESAQVIMDEAQRKGDICLSVEPLRVSRRRGKSTFSLLVFCQQLLSLLDAGLQLVESILALLEKEQDPQHQRVLQDILTDLRSGLSFSGALQRQPDVFPAMLQAAIQASEQTGGTQDALRRFVNYESKFQALKSKLKGALIYPVMLMSMGGLVSLFLLGYVVPRFGEVFADRLSEMPYLSGMVIRIGLGISNHPMGVLGGLVALGVLVYVLVVSPIVRARLLRAVKQAPGLGEMLRAIELIRIYRALGMLLQGGVPAVPSLSMTLGVASSDTQRLMLQAIELIREGQPFSQALKQFQLTTPVCERLILAGERSGQMAEMMNRAADFLDFELEQTLDRTVKLMEPVLMVVIGGIIGAIVILMYLPIFELADSLQ